MIRCEPIAVGALDKDVLVAGEVVEPVGTGEEETRLADVKLELVFSNFAPTCKGMVLVFCHGWSSEETGVHLGWVKGLHHLVRVD